MITTVKKRPKPIDASKFNRSNRKSKNCAIYYFRHPDTDNEGNPSAQSRSELDDEDDEDLLNANTATTSEDEGWIFTTEDNRDDVFVDDDDDDLDEHIIIDDVDDNDNIEEDHEETQSKTTTDGEGNFRRRLQFTPDGVIETTTETHSNLNIATTSTATGTVTETTSVQEAGSSSKISYICVTKATRESIQRLVLGAESLVRDEVLYKAQELQVAGSRMCHAVASVHGGTVDGPLSSPKIRRVQEWLERQPPSGSTLPPSAPLTTDCEASGENTGKL